MLVELYDRSRSRVTIQQDLTPQRYDADAEGGPLSATIDVTGEQLTAVTRWLGYHVIIRNTNLTPVWWGKIIAASYSVGGIEVGVSLDDMRNQVKVFYTYLDGDGYPVSALTDWVSHDASIATYGRRELRHSIAEASDTQAVQMAATILDRLGLPRQVPRLGRGDGDTASLRCAGLWSLLNWTYYENGAGREVDDAASNASHALGWAIAATDIGFADRYIQRMAGGMDGLATGTTIAVAGSTDNDGSYAVTRPAESDLVGYQSATIAFDPTDDIIDDTNGGLGIFEVGAIITVDGSTSNDGYHLLDGVPNRSHLTTDTDVSATIVTESAGNTVTISQAQLLSVDLGEGIFVAALPGDSVTLTAVGTKLAYSFTLSADYDWAPAEAMFRLGRVGTPADNIKVEICADSSGAPGAVLDSATIAGTTLLTRLEWATFALNRTADLEYGTTYWVVLSRTGSNSNSAFYLIGLDEEQSGTGTLKLWDGAAWVNRSTAATLPMQLWGAVETTQQIVDILTDAGQFLSRIDMRPASGLYHRQYRDGTFDALTEIQSLLDAGTTGDETLLPMVTAQWAALVDAAPNSANPPWVVRHGPAITNPYGLPIEEGVLPVGQWCTIDGYHGSATDLAPLSPFLIGYAEYNARQGQITDIRAYGADDIWNFAAVKQG